MITIFESWDSIIHRIGGKPLRRGRGQCPLCESRTGFSCNEDKGFFCFACNAHGDKISFIQQFHKYDFKDALRFLRLEPGKPPKPDIRIERRRRIREGLQNWIRINERNLRNEIYARNLVITRALSRLRQDPDDAWGWDWLAWAFSGYDAIEYKLDHLIGSETTQLEAYKSMRQGI